MLEVKLKAGCEALGLTLDDAQVGLLLTYIGLMDKWNRRFNLTAIRDPEAMVTRHILDSLAVLKHLPAGRVIDVGTGAGMPGVPLAIARPSQRVVVLDANGKKTRFLDHVVLTLGLQNVEVVNARVESFEPEKPFDAVISRAFTSLNAMIETCVHLLTPDGLLLAMKGQYPAQELGTVSGNARVCDVAEVVVPDLTEDRCLVIMAPIAPRTQECNEG